MDSDSFQDQIKQFVQDRMYPIRGETALISRCSDGRYENEDDLPALVKPGADIGDIVALMSMNLDYALHLSHEDMINAFLKTVGGWDNLRAHAHCAFFKCIYTDPAAYGLDAKDIEYLNSVLAKHEKSLNDPSTDEEPKEQVIIVIKSDTYTIHSNSHKPFFEAFIYHKTLDNKRRRLLVKNLLPYINLGEVNLTEEYVYEILSQIIDNHFLETVAKLAKNVPFIEVKIQKDGLIEINEI